jgi:hypothetical protein
MNMAWDKTPAQKEAVKAFLVTTDGKGDLEASVEKYRQVCRQYLAGQTAEQDLVAACMTQLFDLRRGTSLNLDYIKSQTVQLMSKQHPELNDPTLFAMLSKRVEDYLHENCDQAAVEAKGNKPAREAITDRTYGVKRGTGGGFFRKSDASADTK